MVRRVALGLLSVIFVLGLAVASGWARPGGGQNYRAPARSYTPPTRSYNPPPRDYSNSNSYSRSSNTTYVSTPSYGPSYGGGGISGGAILFAFFILAVVFLIIWVRARNRVPQRATIAVDEGLQHRGLIALQQNDPGFDPGRFVGRTKVTVRQVNEAWLKGDMGPARRLISDGVYVRFRTQLELLKADGLRNVMVDWQVVSAELLGANADPLWDTVHVKIVGAARDADVPLGLSDDNARKKAGAVELTQYQEVWSFIRRRGKQSKEGVPALEGKCPNCGADLPMSDVVKCEYCQALVNSGEHDWVLAEITQPEEWRPAPAVDAIPGLDQLRARDPSVSRQELEDRASVVFWKWVEARSTGKNEKLARFCIQPPTNANAAAELGLGVTKLRQVAVGSAELAGVASDGFRDRAAVSIRWSASVAGAEPNTFQHSFTLARAADARSKRGMSSLDCPVCGGQLANSDAPTCSYCGTALSGGKHEWALLGVTSEEITD